MAQGDIDKPDDADIPLCKVNILVVCGLIFSLGITNTGFAPAQQDLPSLIL